MKASFKVDLEMISNEELIEKAKSVVNATKIRDYYVGDVGSALITDRGNIYLGVCMDIQSGIGFCAEHSAIAAMVTAGEYRIEKIVAVWLNDKGETFILSPCGRCREFIRQIHKDNIMTDVVLDIDKVLPLAQLLPYHDWFHLLSVPKSKDINE
jgi:cytidine deaminase